MAVVGYRHAVAALPPGNKYGTYFTGGWVSPRVGLGGYEKSRSPDRPAQVAIPTTLSQSIPAAYRGELKILNKR